MWLVKLDKDWADEFSVYGFAVLTDKEKADWDEDLAKLHDRKLSIHFGTNEGWEDETYDSFFNSDHEWTQISDEDGAVLRKLFPLDYDGLYSFGNFWHPGHHAAENEEEGFEYDEDE